MSERLPQQVEIAIEKAIKSLYQLSVLVEEGTFICHVADCDDDLKSLELDAGEDYLHLFEALYKNTHPEDRENIESFSEISSIHNILSKNQCISIDCRIRHIDSKYYWSRLVICSPEPAKSMELCGFMVLLEDIHAQKTRYLEEQEEFIEAISRLKDDYDEIFIENMKDAQTGCYNRKGLMYYEPLVLKDAAENQKDLYVCVLDLNGLKHMNDTYGHSAGDEALRVVSEALKKAVPEGSFVVRTGGDEFLVFCALPKGSGNPEQVELLIEEYLRNYNDSHDNPFSVSASYGQVISSDAESLESMDELIELADQKMYQMKEVKDPYKR